MKKILVTVIDYYPKESGVPHVTKYLAEGLAREGYDITIATSSVDKYPDIEIVNGVKIHRFDVKASSYRIPKGQVEEYKEWFRKQEVDIVINSCKPVWSTTLVLKELKDKQCIKILHSHGAAGLYCNNLIQKSIDLKHMLGNLYRYFASRYLFNIYFPKYIQEYDKVLCLSKNCGREYSYFKKYITEDRIEELGNAADDIFFADNQTNNILKYIGYSICNYCISVSNFNIQKNHKVLLREFYLSGVSNSLVLIGKDYSTLNHLKRQKAKLDKKYGFHEVFFIENMDRNDIPGILDGAVLYICSSRWEGYSVSLIEAMARKVPFVSTDVGNARSLPGGLIADDTELHKVISEVINNKELRSKLSMAGYEYAVNNCQVNNKVKELIGIIESIN